MNVIIDLTSPYEQWAMLGDGFKVEARIVVYENDDATKVPASSLFRHGDEWAVYLVAGGHAHLRKIKIGHRSAVDAEILSGVKPGDHVVVYPSDAAQDGIRIKAEA